MSGRGPEYERELAELREVLDRPALGVSREADLALLRGLIDRYPDEAAEFLARLRGAT